MTAPSVTPVNGHFAAVGEDGEGFEHGVQVIDEDKEFKYVLGLHFECGWTG